MLSIVFFFIFSVQNFITPFGSLYFENYHVDAAGANGQEHGQQLQLQVCRSCRLLLHAVGIGREGSNGTAQHHDDTEGDHDVERVEHWNQVHAHESGGCKNCLSNPLHHVEDDAKQNPCVIDPGGIV